MPQQKTRFGEVVAEKPPRGTAVCHAPQSSQVKSNARRSATSILATALRIVRRSRLGQLLALGSVFPCALAAAARGRMGGRFHGGQPCERDRLTVGEFGDQ